ncbi:testis-specific serine/threonine-protein kinase 5-like [Aplochiton taeniatus]
MSSSAKSKEPGTSLQERALECRENGYLLSAKKIGTGAFSKVYLGYATPSKICQNYKLANDLRSKNHNMVAIKIISINDAPPEYSKKFLHREIYALNATYRHPGVIQLYDMFRSAKRFYLVVELALRGDLLEHVNAASQSRGASGLGEEEARRIFKQIVNAVMHCHNNHIVHRDLKCENILLDEQGFVKLTDFGFANHCTDRSALMNTFCGSVAYTAPEILLSRKYNGEQADLWSLGVILYAMVTGRLPYHEKHPRKLVQLIRKDLPFQHPVSLGCEDLIKKLLQWTPSARLPLGQVSTHHWMMPSMAGVTYKLRATKSDIADKQKALSNKEVSVGVTGRSCHSGPAEPLPCFRQSHTSLADGPHRTPGYGPPRQGAISAGGNHKDKREKERRDSSLGRLLMRPTQGSDTKPPTRLFLSRPRPPAPPHHQPFHNLPNFRRPGASSRELVRPSRPLHSLCGRLLSGTGTPAHTRYRPRTPSGY